MVETNPAWAGLTGATGTVCVVRVAQRAGLGSVTAGELAVVPGATTAGALLGGAVDDAVARLADRVLAGGEAVSEEVVVGETGALAAGLACGGRVTLLAHPLDVDAARALGAALAGGEPAVLAGGAAGAQVLAGGDLGRRTGSMATGAAAPVDEAAATMLRRGASATGTVDTGAGPVLVDLWVPVPRVVVVGAGVLGAALAAQAELLGWRSETVLDVAGAETAVAGMGAADVLVLLDHSPDFDGALLACARGPAFAGALGSRHTQTARRERLRAAGATDEELARVRGPVGLDLGSRTPAETAVSVVAEVLARRGGRTAAALGASTGRIGG